MYDFSQHLQQITEFHRVCHHPIGTIQRPLLSDRLTTRLTWALDELFEFALAADDVDRIDALNDCAYFIGGTLVEMGVFFFVLERHHEKIDHPALLKRLTRLCMTGTHQETLEGQAGVIREALTLILDAQASWYSADFATTFTFVHDGNMTKRWPDGLPHHDPDDAGKILKPPTWRDPKQQIAAYLATLTPQTA